MTRKEIYQKIKDECLEESIKRTFKKNYTNIKTEVLEEWLLKNDSVGKKLDNLIGNCNKGKTRVIEVNSDDYTVLLDAFTQLVSMLIAHRAITPMEGEELMDAIFK